MSVDFTINQGDTLPILSDTLTYSDGSAVNLVGASVQFVMRALTAAAPIINAEATVVSASAGTISFTFSATNSAVPGLFMGNWVVTFSGGSQMTFPTEGWLELEVQANLTSAGVTQLVSVDDVKDVLNFQSSDRSHDTKILRWIQAVRPLIETITGPIIPQTFEEWHDGGFYRVALRYAPSTALGTSPILIVNAISEYNGPIEWPLALVSTLDEAVLYSVIVEVQRGIITRSTAGGGVQAFPNMPSATHIWYTAGQNTVPPNVYEATLELLRVNYQRTAQSSNTGWGNGANSDDEIPSAPMGFFMPNRVRELLSPNRRAPSVA